MDRKTELLIATLELLNKQKESLYTLNILETPIFYDGVECDGECLREDIENCIMKEKSVIEEMK